MRGSGETEPGAGKPLKEGRGYINEPPLSPLLNEEGKREARGGEGGGSGQYFGGVAPEVWNFHIGGYQVCEKWFEDRRRATLSYHDLEHYSKVVTALSETIRLMAEIGMVIPSWPIACFGN
jgi:hypothetical protein